MDAAQRSGLDLLVEMSGPGTRRVAVENALREAIRSGRLGPRTRLPSSRDLAEQLGLARGTVTQAYAQLVAEGWVVGAVGRGTWVADGAAAPLAAPVPAEPVPPAPVHDLRPGRPDVAAFPREAWARELLRVARDAPAAAFGYGDPRGRPELRATLAAYLGRVRGVRVDPDHLVICSGYTQALHLLADVLADAGGRTAAMEDPAMADHVAIVARRLRVIDAPVDDGGIVPPDPAPDVVVCTPAHQFPSGVTMTPARRAELLRMARTAGTWIVEDDYDGDFRYARHPIGALQGRLPDKVIYVGSTSKSLGPAVRLGWIACPPRLLGPLTAAKELADRQTGSIEQLAFAGLLGTGAYDRHLRAARLAYRRRRDALTEAVARRLPGARIAGPAAGLHTILEVPGGAEPDLQRRLRAASVQVHTLGHYLRRASAGDRPASLVIGFATPPAHAYGAALAALLDTLAGR
ncbi:PLP-dependent aminotransferase family protein [Dactylosporangium sp. NPDC051484]|uniref:MocR-like pyridoxine biosynthesis transcription factor PdxR n=1 Tax=Dactylosporangium sp. NPDC051484 TaxID=3154942 RepID=UPI00345106F8